MFNFLKSTPVLIFSALFVRLVASQGVSAPLGFNITSLELNGSGCPPGSVSYVLNPDRTSVNVTFSKYEVQAGPGVPITNNRKSCQLKFGIRVPQGFSFGVETVDYSGYYNLAPRVTLSQQVIYYFQGQTSQATARSTLVGPVPGNIYSYRDTFDLFSTVTAPCGAMTFLNIKSAIQIDNSANPGVFLYILTYDNDGSLKQTFNFQWRRC